MTWEQIYSGSGRRMSAQNTPELCHRDEFTSGEFLLVVTRADGFSVFHWKLSRDGARISDGEANSKSACKRAADEAICKSVKGAE